MDPQLNSTRTTREQVYDNIEQWGALAGLEEYSILQAQIMFHQVATSVCCLFALASHCGNCGPDDYGQAIEKYT